MLLSHLAEWASSFVTLGITAAIGVAIHYIIFHVAKRSTGKNPNSFEAILVRHSEKPTRAIIAFALLLGAVQTTKFPRLAIDVLERGLTVALIASIAWLMLHLTNIVEDLVRAKYNITSPDNLTARRVRTQIQLLRKIAATVIIVFALASILMTFPRIRDLGTSIFASAGLAGLVVGLAARPTLGNMIAGLQVALTQPIRIDDVVIVEGEWGWIEEINTTFVQVRIWDLRRMILPISYFIEKPFQNWTRVTANLLGTVFVYVDYTVPVEEVRNQLHTILKSTPLWDSQVWNLQVTNATEKTVELRALMSAADSNRLWDLRCYVREHLLQFLQEKYPQSLPRVRAEIGGNYWSSAPLSQSDQGDRSGHWVSNR